MIVAIVGMTGSGKTTVSEMLVKEGFQFIRLGQITLDIVKERGLMPTEENERPIREDLRKKHGMEAFATLNFPKIDEMLNRGDVVADGLYSWEEYLAFKHKYKKDFKTLAIICAPKVRYGRLGTRKYDPKNDEAMQHRPHNQKEA